MAFKLLIKNKFISSIIGTLSVYFGIAFILPLNTFSVYITSYIHYKDNYVTMHYGLFIYLIFGLAASFSSSLGGYFENLFGFFQTIIIGFSILFISNFFFIFQRNIWLCYVLSFILGIGAGISISLIGKNLTLYCPNKKGILFGTLGIGIMIITAIFALGGEKLINFEGETLKEDQNFYNEKIAKKTYLYFLIGEFFIPIGLIFGLLLIYEYKPEENLTKENENIVVEKKEETKEKDKLKEKNLRKKTKQNVKQALKTIKYWRITLISFLIKIAISFMINTGRTFGALIGINGSALQFAGMIQVLSVLMIGPCLGFLVDKKGPLLILRISSIINIIPGILLALFMSNSFIFISSLVLYILNLTGFMVSFGPFIMEVYGIHESVILGGIINGFSKIADIITTVSAFSFSLVCADAKDESGENDEKGCLKKRYKYMYFISAICCLISALLLFFEKKEKFKYEKIAFDLLDSQNDNKNGEENQNENKVLYFNLDEF